ncbi:MAG: hypothetical protein ACI82Z_000836, partial [Cellvibrionaceae bacterium]
MTTIFLAFVLLALVILAMSVGILLGRRPISGSCGGIGAALGEKNYSCDICGSDPKKCREIVAEKKVKEFHTELFVDAMESG